MTDEQFDDLAKETLAFEAGPPSAGTWKRIKLVRWSWLPTVREVLVCGSISALALVLIGVRITSHQGLQAESNPIVHAAMHDETRLVLASVTQFPGMPALARTGG